MIRAYPVINEMTNGEGFFRRTRQKNAGIIGLFQVFLTRYGEKDPSVGVLIISGYALELKNN